MDAVTRGQRLAELREGAGLLQRQVGAEFDIDKAAVSEWERGKSNPSRERLLRLDQLFHADGEVLRMYDVAPDTAAEISRLQSRLDRLVLEIEAQLQVVAAKTETLGDNLHTSDRDLAARINAVEQWIAHQERQAK